MPGFKNRGMAGGAGNKGLWESGERREMLCRPKESLNCFRILKECHTTTLCLGIETGSGSDAPKRAEREYGWQREASILTHAGQFTLSGDKSQ